MLVDVKLGKAFEYMLAYELCSASDLYGKILDGQSSSIKFKLSDVKTMIKLPAEIVTPHIITDGGYEQGAHKIDIVFPYMKEDHSKGVIYFQVVNQDHNANQTRKLNDKMRKSILAFSEYAPENAIFVFASYHDFNVTSYTDKWIQRFDENWEVQNPEKKTISRLEQQRIDEINKQEKKFKVLLLHGKDFESLSWPFHMFADKEKLTDANLLGKLVTEQKEEIFGSSKVEASKYGTRGSSKDEEVKPKRQFNEDFMGNVWGACKDCIFSCEMYGNKVDGGDCGICGHKPGQHALLRTQ